MYSRFLPSKSERWKPVLPGSPPKKTFMLIISGLLPNATVGPFLLVLMSGFLRFLLLCEHQHQPRNVDTPQVAMGLKSVFFRARGLRFEFPESVFVSSNSRLYVLDNPRSKITVFCAILGTKKMKTSPKNCISWK